MKTKEKNIWKRTTIILGVIVLFLIGWQIYQAEKEAPQDNSIKDIRVHFCQTAQSTPSWGTINGNIVDSGYKDFYAMKNMSYDVVNEVLIPNNIFFIYHSDCGWCKKQIELFGIKWQDYVNSGLTINCKEIDIKR